MTRSDDDGDVNPTKERTSIGKNDEKQNKKKTKKTKKKSQKKIEDEEGSVIEEVEAAVTAKPQDDEDDCQQKRDEIPNEGNDKKRKKKKKKKKRKSGEAVDGMAAAEPTGKKQKLDGELKNDIIEAEEREMDHDLKRQYDHDDSSEDDDEILAAAAQWADQDDNDDDDGNKTHNETQKQPSAARSHEVQEENQNLSLHITQLPYDTNELDLRRLFAEQGCRISSIRLVYDRDEHGRKTLFRGVAFVDLLDLDSYESAIKLNRKCTIRGRKLNVRPTRTKQELSDIVERTQKLVQEKIRMSTGNGGGDDNDDDSKKASRESFPKQTKKLSKGEKDKSKKGIKAKKDTKLKKDSDHKLTKKERNRRAAIIMSKRRKQGK